MEDSDRVATVLEASDNSIANVGRQSLELPLAGGAESMQIGGGQTRRTSLAIDRVTTFPALSSVVGSAAFAWHLGTGLKIAEFQKVVIMSPKVRPDELRSGAHSAAVFAELLT